MCGRFGVSYEVGQARNLIDLYLAQDAQGLDEAFPAITRSSQVRPTNRGLVIFRHDDVLRASAGYWTLVPKWFTKDLKWTSTKSGKPSLHVGGGRVHFNSRIDTLTSSPGWRRLLQHNRCLIFLNSYYEWSDEEMLGQGQKKVGRFAVKGSEGFPVAGIYSWIDGPDGEPLLTFSIITTAPNEMMTALPHHRMPAILDVETAKSWLEPASTQPEGLIQTFPEKKNGG